MARILYFAWLRERMGRTEEALPLPSGVATVGELVALLRAGRGPAEAFDSGAEMAALLAGRTDVGGVGCFVGLVRDSAGGQPVRSMTLEHYPGMTERALASVAAEAESRWALQGCTVIHR